MWEDYGELPTLVLLGAAFGPPSIDRDEAHFPFASDLEQNGLSGGCGFHALGGFLGSVHRGAIHFEDDVARFELAVSHAPGGDAADDDLSTAVRRFTDLDAESVGRHRAERRRLFRTRRILLQLLERDVNRLSFAGPQDLELRIGAGGSTRDHARQIL